MTEKEKIKKYLEYKNISKNKFYQQTGLSIGFLDSGNSLGVDKARIIINTYPDINLEWLIMDSGPMLRDGAGDPIVTDTPKAPEQPCPTQNTTSMDQIYRKAAGDSSGEMLLNIIRMKDEELREQAIEIGRLRERISLIQSGTQIVGGGKLPNPPTQMPPAQAAPAPLPPDPEPPTPKPAKLPLARLQSASCATDASRNVPK